MESMVLASPLVGLLSTWMYPLWTVALGAGLVLVAILLLFLGARVVAPRIMAVAQTTAKESLSQTVFYVVLAIGLFGLLLSPFVPYFTFGEDVKMLMSVGLVLIKSLAVILALWTASVSISDEIDGRTALTLLSKPISRMQFVLGKFLGVIWPVALIFVILGALFLSTVSYKVVYDARETANPEPSSEQCIDAMTQVVPGLVLAFLETITLVSISVAISTRLGMLPNLVICVSVYLLGNIIPLMVRSTDGQFPLVNFMAEFFATILPVLVHFSTEAAISTGSHVPWSYVGTAGIYCGVFCTLAILVALLLFEDRDLA